jgi:NHLM bacteriocin system ABC transporter ATP-binding protein
MMNEKQTTDRFLLVDESKTWLVEQGNADLFLVDVEGEELIGPLFHALTVAAGGVVLGTGRAEWQGRTVTMVCQPRSGAVLESMPRTEAEGDPLKLWMRELREAAELDASTAFHDLSALHKTSLEALADKREAIEQTETARLQLKDDARSATVNRALRDLGSVLHIGEDAEIAAPGTGMNVLAACRMIGRHLGVEMRMPKGFTASGNPLNDAAVLARASSVRYRDVVLKGAWWKQDNGPLLAFRPSETGNAPAVALALIRCGRAYFVSDTEKGTRDRLTPELASSIAPKAVMFYRPFPPRPLGWSDLLLFGLHGTWRDVFTMLAVGAATGLLALLMPVATGILFDTIIPGAQRGQLYQMAIMLFAASITGFLISLTANVAMMRMEGRMEAGVQSAVWDRLLSLPVRFFKQYNSGDLVGRSLAIGQIRQMLTGAVLTSLLTGVFSIFSFILLFQYSSSLALIATVLVLVAALMSASCGWLQMRNQRAIYEVMGRISGLTLDLMSGIAKLRMSGTESQAFARWAEEFTKQKSISNRAARVSIAMTIFSRIFPSVTGIAIFYFGWNMMKGGAGLTPGGFVAFNAAFGQFLGASLGLAMTAISVIGIIPAYERAKPILKAIPEAQGASSLDPGRLHGAIECSRILFRYESDLPLVLNDISIQIKPGQFVAFVGHSGSGKSTLFRLLLGFETPESGSIYFDGMDLADIDPQALRRQMGVVMQNGKVFDGDIFTNIVGASPLTIADAWAAARSAGFDKDIEAMPMGMNTVISEGGGGLSGGQRQRLMIARAIVHRPRILLFDEATSALDNQTQSIVSRSLEALEATRIVIAHRLSTIINADQIYVFDQGRITQHGTYEELAGQEGLFRDLAQRQIA